MGLVFHSGNNNNINDNILTADITFNANRGTAVILLNEGTFGAKEDSKIGLDEEKLPIKMDREPLVVAIDSEECQDSRLVGGKGSSLAVMSRYKRCI